MLFLWKKKDDWWKCCMFSCQSHRYSSWSFMTKVQSNCTVMWILTNTSTAVVVSGSAASLSGPRSSLLDFFLLVTFTIPLRKKRCKVFRNSCAIITENWNTIVDCKATLHGTTICWSFSCLHKAVVSRNLMAKTIAGQIIPFCFCTNSTKEIYYDY